MPVRAPLALIAVAVALLGGLLASAAGAERPPRARALALVASGTIGPHVDVGVRRDGRRSRSGGVQHEALTVGSGQSIAQARTPGLDAEAQAVAVARSVRALDGLVTAFGVRRRLTDDGDGLSSEGRVNGLVIDGRTIGDVDQPRTYDLPDDAGTVTVNQGGAGLRIVLTKPVAGQPAGTDIRVAVVGASARDGAAEADPAPTSTPAPTATPADRRDKRKRARRARPLRKAPARLYGTRFVFPVTGAADVANDFGGPRQIGPHEGNDIFAPFGSRVLAVADGRLGKIGTLPISGNRLWLYTDAGDAFFYAHLSAFAPAAVNGARVKAGTVLGFVGNTGDAEPTPPHLHFEVHPGGQRKPAIDPHRVLLSWARHDAAAPEERPGALVEVRDFIAGD